MKTASKPETAQTRRFFVPLPPPVPAGAIFRGYTIEGHAGAVDAICLASAVDLWLERGTLAELYAECEVYESSCGESRNYISRFNSAQEQWEPWKQN